MALGKLDIIIAGDTAQLRKDMSTAVGIMQSSTKQMESFAKNASTAIAGYFTVDFMKGQITSSLNYADSLSKLSQKSGITANQLYSLNAAAKLSDVEFEALSGSLSKFNKNIGEASLGSGDALNAFKNLGISVKNQDGTLKNSFDLIEQISDKFADMPDGAAKATLAMQLFGKSGAAMIPLLNGGSDALKEYLGIMDEETGAAAERFNDSFTRMHLAMNAVHTKTLKDLAPSINFLSGYIEELADESLKTSDAMAGSLSRGIDTVVGNLYSIAVVSKDVKTDIFNLGSDIGKLADQFSVASKDDGGLGLFKQSILGLEVILDTMYVGLHNSIVMMTELAVSGKNLFTGDESKDFLTRVNSQILTGDDLLNKYINSYQLLTKAQKDFADTKNNKTTGKKSGTDVVLDDGSAKKKAKDEAEKLSKEWAQRSVDITKNISIAQQDELAKPYIVLSTKYDEDLAHFKGIKAAKEQLTAEYTANVERLNLDTIAKVLKADEDALKKTQQDKKEAIEHALKMQEEGFRIQSRYINLLDDETDRKVALAHLEANRNNTSLKAQYELGEIDENYYKTALGYEEDLLKKTLEHYTAYGQVIDGVASGMESSFSGFFDYSNAGFLKLGDLAEDVLNEIYNEIMRVAVVKPLVSGLTTSAFSFFQAYDGGMIPYASGGYTGDGGKYEPKGVVHGGEYVIPSWMVQKNKPLISNLENVRARGYAEGGSVGGNVGSGGNIKVEIKNESSSSLQVTSATQTFDSEGAVLSIVIDGIQKNKMGLRDMLGSR